MNDPTVTNRYKTAPTVTTRCKVCNHPRRAEFDAALVAGTMTQDEIARLVDCSKMAVSRHKENHLIPAASALVRADPVLANANVDILGELRTLYRNMKRNLARVDGTDNWPAIRAFNAETRRNLELLAKLLLVLDTRGGPGLTQSAEWAALRTRLVKALAPFPEASRAVSQSLLEIDSDD